VSLEQLTASQGQKIIDELRKGIPPHGYVEDFTIGRKQEIEWLDDHLEEDSSAFALLLKANYGSGKTHLLQLIKEKALKKDYLVSSVVLDAKSGVRFNRLDQVFGAIMRGLETALDDHTETGGLETILNFFATSGLKAVKDPEHDGHEFWKKLSNGGKWDYSDVLSSPQVYVALRAWIKCKEDDIRNLVLDWLRFPENYQNQRKTLYWKLVGSQRRYFRDIRPEHQFYEDAVLEFPAAGGYADCWAALEDFQQLAINSLLPGVAVLFDEFEDVLTNLNNIDWQKKAFFNLFRFVSGARFTGKTFYAVTPAFVEKCKQRLLGKGAFDFDYSQFDKLPTFAMSPLGGPDMQQLARTIIAVHERAYGHRLAPRDREEVISTAGRAGFRTVEDRTRQAIKECVQHLDGFLD
jgi:hypothetical protein